MAAFAARPGPAESDPLGDSGLHWFGDDADEGGMGGASAHSRAGAGTVTQHPHVFDPSTASEWEASPADSGDVSGSMGDWAQPSRHPSHADGGGGGHGGGHGGPAPMDWYDPDDMENEPPLLQELGIDMSHIKQKLVAIVDPRSRVNMEAVQDGDLFGPILICLALGTTLLLRGQVHFGSIYGFGLVGCLGMYLVLNLMSTGRGIDAASVFSVFGYGLLPITVLAALSVVLPLSGALGVVVAPVCVAWSAWCATRFYEAALAMPEQRALIAYPTVLLYAVFALLAVF
ncbi:hypothetical protein FNF27_07288 [Cafeteria roenbergensis]|uniref:Protein YIPF n=1 Tax=Cafeteria roenbergensis TaxID=33653 RepID=A0A5A8DQE3_CAFRO|nr:hypothetical protein FNF27_07288 [Cafeteria roenbergensis]|mmetsp:Transcript_23971/g.90561  ORF Transcript_23971/g.90561 Transcript_23971/m.90561 type:complete len:287 (-) Transcript_23971:35-895(-)